MGWENLDHLPQESSRKHRGCWRICRKHRETMASPVLHVLECHTSTKLQWNLPIPASLSACEHRPVTLRLGTEKRKHPCYDKSIMSTLKSPIGMAEKQSVQKSGTLITPKSCSTRVAPPPSNSCGFQEFNQRLMHLPWDW